MTRLGKIARLPREIREELNVRLQNGEVGRVLVEWLNGLPAAQEALKERFEGRAITEQNLSEWKQGGYEDWVRHQENCAYALMLTEMAEDLEEEAGKTPLEERLAALMAVALARLLREAEEAPAGAERTKMILDVARQLSQLRRDGQQAERLRMERERWEEKQLEIELKQRKEADERARTRALWDRTKAEFPALRRQDEMSSKFKVQSSKGARPDLAPPPQERERTKGKEARPHRGPLPQERERIEAAAGESDQIQPIQSSKVKGQGSRVARPQERELTNGARGESDKIAPDQTEETKEDGKRKQEESADSQAVAQPHSGTKPT